MPASWAMCVLPFFLPFSQYLRTVGQTEGASKIPLSWQPTATDPVSRCMWTLKLQKSFFHPATKTLQSPYNLPSVLPCTLLILLTSTAATQPQSSAHCQTANDSAESPSSPLLCHCLLWGRPRSWRRLWYGSGIRQMLSSQPDVTCLVEKVFPHQARSLPPRLTGIWNRAVDLLKDHCLLKSHFRKPEIAVCNLRGSCFQRWPHVYVHLCVHPSYLPPRNTSVRGKAPHKPVLWVCGDCHAACVLVVPALAVCTSQALLQGIAVWHLTCLRLVQLKDMNIKSYKWESVVSWQLAQMLLFFDKHFKCLMNRKTFSNESCLRSVSEPQRTEPSHHTTWYFGK